MRGEKREERGEDKREDRETIRGEEVTNARRQGRV
jgi:hypothetical protein